MWAAELFDELLVNDASDAVGTFLTECNEIFQYVTVVHGPDTVGFYGMNILQNEVNLALMPTINYQHWYPFQ